MVTSLISFFTNFQTYIIIAAFILLFGAGAFFYIKYENARYAVAQASITSLTTANAQLVRQSQSLIAATTTANASITATKASTASTAAVIKGSTYTATTATTQLSGIMSDMVKP